VAEIPDFLRRAMEAQGKVDPDEVAALAASIDLDEQEGPGLAPVPPEPEQETFDLPPPDEGQAPGYTDDWIPE